MDNTSNANDGKKTGQSGFIHQKPATSPEAKAHANRIVKGNTDSMNGAGVTSNEGNKAARAQGWNQPGKSDNK